VAPEQLVVPFSWSGDAPEMTALRADEATLGPVRADEAARTVVLIRGSTLF
jgi:hypothetical protein